MSKSSNNFSNSSVIVLSETGGLGTTGRIHGHYATNVIEKTTDGKKDFTTQVYRCPTEGVCTIDTALHIGTRNSTGTLELNSNKNEKDEKYLDALDKKTRSQSDDLVTGLTAAQQDLYNLRTGNGNQALIAKIKAEGNGISDERLQELLDEAANAIPDDAFNNDINIEIPRNARTTYGHYCYPEDIKNDRTQDRIKFTMKYSKGSRIQTSTETGVQPITRREQKIKGSVTLPIQSGIKDQNSVRWNGSSLNALQAFGAAGALSIFNAASGGAPIQDVASRTGELFAGAARFLKSNAGADARTAINVYLAQQAVGAQNLLSRTAGAIVNPNVEMLFDAPSLRPFSFQFRMSPRDEDEAAQVRSILAFFKQGMSVKTSSSNIFLKAPNIFDIRYITYNDDNEIDHPSINRIKTCALLAAEVDYTPDNSYMTYDDPRRTMTSYGLTLQFNELDPIYEDDYEDLGFTNSTNTANEIGF